MTDSGLLSCNACRRSFKRDSDRTQHFNLTNNLACRKVGEEYKAQLRQSRFPYHHNNTQLHQQKLPTRLSSQSLPPPSPPLFTEQFTGDFFGHGYTSSDFPGFGEGIESEEETEDEDEDENAENTAALESQWEPERPMHRPARNDIDIDSHSTFTSVSKPNPLLRHLPSHRDNIHVQEFGGQAGAPLPDSESSQHIRSAYHGFSTYQSKVTDNDLDIWSPFASEVDFRVAHWAKMRGPGSNAVSDLLEIEGVVEALGLSYRNTRELNKIIDTQLPPCRPAFIREEVVIAGESFDFYKRDIVECIRALYSNPEHAQYLCFTPERHYADANKTVRLYHDLNTGRWWWDTQRAVEAEKPGATIVPVIISSDKTQITLFRNKSAYPVYMTIGNLPKEIRRKPSQQGQILLAYLPTTRLEHITNKAARRRTVTNLFHACMGNLTKPLQHAGLEGIIMQSGDGIKRRCHPILAAYVGDYPEQVLATTAYSGDCPLCETEKDELGVYPCTHAYRDIEAALNAAHSIGSDTWAEQCLEVNLKPVQHPFWSKLPYTNIFASITPDILHQLYQGVMKHLILWLTSICGADEIDARVRRLPPNHTIRIFHKGISTLSRVSGTEHKQMCAFILGTVTDIPGLSSHQSNTLLSATRALLDFLYLACYPIHSTESLDQLDKSLAAFHVHRDIFISLGVREHFNLPKLHFLCHYTRAIKLYGTTDNYNTETTERLHIDFAKNAYRASNHKDEYPQMTHWLERREKMVSYANYITWRLSDVGTAYEDDMSTADSSAQVIGARFDFPGAQRTLIDMQCQYTAQMTRFPTVNAVALTKLEDTGAKGYSAVSFRHALKRFLVQYRDPTVPLNQLDEYAQFVVLPFKSLPVWHKIKFINTGLHGKQTLDSISARPRKFDQKGELVQHARFDTALITLGEGDDWSKNTRIGRVRVVFSISDDQLRTLVPPDIPFPPHLVYIEWFSKLSLAPEASSGLYRVKREITRNGNVAASIVSLDMITRSVHLFPRWEGSVPVEWTSETVLDLASSFLLNIFKDNHSYFNFT